MMKQILESMEVGDADERECEKFSFLLFYLVCFVVLTCECQRDLVFCLVISSLSVILFTHLFSFLVIYLIWPFVCPLFLHIR